MISVVYAAGGSEDLRAGAPVFKPEKPVKKEEKE